jgi:hypothetical protein
MVYLPRAIYFKETPLVADLFLAGLREAADTGFSTIPAWSQIRRGGPPLDEPPHAFLVSSA